MLPFIDSEPKPAIPTTALTTPVMIPASEPVDRAGDGGEELVDAGRPLEL
jgi:hypothetical protein